MTATNPVAEPETNIDEISTKLKFESFNRFCMGRGFVAYQQSEAERSAGQYDPHIMFVHDNSENTDEASLLQVEKDCAELARLLSKFRIANECITENVIQCRVVSKG